MSRLLFCCIFISILSCQEEPQPDYAVLSGTISNPKNDGIILYKGQEKVSELSLDDQGKFSDTLNTIDAGYYMLVHGRENTAVYLSPGDNVSISLDTNQFDESISYSGIGAEPNNYLASKFLKEEESVSNPSDIYLMNENDFQNKISQIKEAYIKLLDSANITNQEFLEQEKKNIEYEYLLNLQNYPTYHSYYAKDPNFEASEIILEPLSEIDFDNEEDYKNLNTYKQIVLNHYSSNIEKSDDVSKTFQTINESLSDEAKADLAKRLVYEINPNNDQNEAYFDGISMLTSDEELLNRVGAKFEKVQTLTKGNPSPVFTNYENHKGGTLSLSDLKGKYVYIDVWATWCGPCKVEIPYLKEVEEKYHNKNISFVSTSIDEKKDYDTWVKMVKDKELGGIQLMADNNWNSQFVTDYAIEGIPRFILVDPDGNIVTADAPRPSDPKLIEMFEDLDI